MCKQILLGEVEIPACTLQGETGAAGTSKGRGDWNRWLTGKKNGKSCILCVCCGLIDGFKVWTKFHLWSQAGKWQVLLFGEECFEIFWWHLLHKH